MTRAYILCAALAVTACLATPAAASHDPHSYSGYSATDRKVSHVQKNTRAAHRADRRDTGRHLRHVRRGAPVDRVSVRTASAVRYLPHPSGCPTRAFCGCGAAVEVFGRPIRSLWLARAWYRFPRSSPAPGAVAVRRHHVFVLRQWIAGDRWLVADHNSGGRKSRLHVRSIAGLTIVSPRGGLASCRKCKLGGVAG